MTAWLALLGAFLLLLGVLGLIADWWEDPDRRDARERNR